MSQSIDQWPMLFSADWFRPHWAKLGVHATSAAQSKFQQACQTIVRQLIDDAETYWLISFDDARIAETKRRFLEATDATLEPGSRARVRELLSFDGSFGDEAAQAAAVMFVNDRLTGSRGDTLPPLPTDIRELVAQTWMKYRPTETDLKQVALESTSSWDVFLRGLTPDLPAYLWDFVGDFLRQSFDIRGFWHDVNAKLSASEEKTLLAWYRESARQMLGQEITKPSWMTM